MLVNALVFKVFIGSISFYSMTHMVFQALQLRQEVVGLMSGPLIVSERPKIDT